MICFGTRPEAIKMAPLVLEFQKYPEKAEVVVAVTGQHREMLHQVLDVFKIKPDYDLDIMQPKQTLAQITTKALQGLDEIMRQERPDVVLVQGDTTTTFAAGLAAFYNKVAVGHVEAGLRTENKYDPFPEEMNRRLTSVISDLHFAPTSVSKNNLLAEGIPADRISITGNTVIDALLSIAEKPFTFDDPVLAEATSGEQRMILVTAHRRENWGEPMQNICNAVKEISQKFTDTCILFAMHKNPIVRETVVPTLGGLDRVHLIEPPDYVPFVHLLKSAHLVLTDSGGVQEEAPGLGKPVLVMRRTTERPEGVEAGTAKLVGTDTAEIVSEAAELLSNPEAYNKMAKAVNPYGEGDACASICKRLFEHFGIG